jgi:DNA-binding SARP family transcriptional activator
VDFRILGPLEVLDEERPVPLLGSKQRALLVLLLLRANEVVSSDRLMDEIWTDKQPRSGSTALRVLVSQLRKSLGAGDVLATRSPGYVLRIGPDELDLLRFERLVSEADGTEPATAASTLREALSLWRGPPLADVTYAPFAQAAIGRLEELRLVALERRIDADLALGRHDELVSELRSLAREHPLRERLSGQLMLALYRSGRQAEALEAYRAARRVLVDELGLEPGPALQELEGAILRQDPVLALDAGPAVRRSVVVVPGSRESLDSLLALAKPLAATPARELIVARVVGREELATVSEELSGLGVRAAAFSSASPGRDLVRLAAEQDADLLVLDGPLTAEVEVVLDGAPCDVALVPESKRPVPIDRDRPVLVPFTGAEDDWAAIELGAWMARAADARLVLAGSSEGRKGGDASRLLASASLIVQRAIGIGTSPLLVEPGVAGIVEAAERAGLVVLGLPRDWRQKGLGKVRAAVAREARPPVLIVRKGLRPGGLAPRESLTRFTWSLGG